LTLNITTDALFCPYTLQQMDSCVLTQQMDAFHL